MSVSPGLSEFQIQLFPITSSKFDLKLRSSGVQKCFQFQGLISVPSDEFVVEKVRTLRALFSGQAIEIPSNEMDAHSSVSSEFFTDCSEFEFLEYPVANRKNVDDEKFSLLTLSDVGSCPGSSRSEIVPATLSTDWDDHSGEMGRIGNENSKMEMILGS